MREPKPFLRSQNQTWYVTLKGKQYPLGRDKDEAFQLYHMMLAGSRQMSPTAPAVQVLNEFLAWTSRNREPSTYTFYKIHVESFARFIGLNLRASDLKPLHITRWIDREFAGQSDNTKHNAIRAVKRAFNWAKKQGIITASPVEGVEMPPTSPRETFITPDQYATVMALVKDQPFRDFLTALWETGCRPQEVRIVEASNFDPERGVWIFERKRSKGKRRRRVVYLTPNVVAITQRLAEQNPTGPIFRNVDGVPWKKNAVMNRFTRLRKKVDFPLHAYAFRHGFATDRLRQGVDPLRVSLLMGHRDTRMLETVYQHVDKDDAHLKAGLLEQVAKTGL